MRGFICAGCYDGLFRNAVLGSCYGCYWGRFLFDSVESEAWFASRARMLSMGDMRTPDYPVEEVRSAPVPFLPSSCFFCSSSSLYLN